MTPTQKRLFIVCLLLAVAAFALAGLPNAAASDNLAMVQMFEPDEAAPLPALLKMIAPAENVDKALRAFVFYEYYYYGFPYFALSALLILPLQWLGRLGELPLVMLVLRQMVSVLPMLAALLVLVYLQDGFRTYRSPVLFAFLLSVPAVWGNNLWWHADGLTFLFVALTLFFLARDRLRFGRYFLLAAVMSGWAAATKLVGVYFFLAVGLTLLLGLGEKKTSVKRLAGMALAYLGVMAGAFLVGNPFLVSGWARTGYYNTVIKQSGLLAQGYGVVYEKGLAAAWPIMHPYFGEALFLLAALAVALWGAWRGPRRLLFGLIVAWFIPVSVTVLGWSHFKFQYWLPAALPLLSCLVLLLPEKLAGWRGFDWRRAARAGALLLVGAQMILFVRADAQRIYDKLHRAEGNPRIAFYDQAVRALEPGAARPAHVYYDYRLYVPETPGWSSETSYDLLAYDYIRGGNFDVLLLLQQRINDYLNPNVTGIDPVTFPLNQAFYRDADAGQIEGYRLVYRDDVGLVYVRILD